MIRDLTTEKLINLTNCKPPCTFYKYDVVKRLDTSASVDYNIEGYGKFLSKNKNYLFSVATATLEVQMSVRLSVRPSICSSVRPSVNKP